MSSDDPYQLSEYNLQLSDYLSTINNYNQELFNLSQSTDESRASKEQIQNLIESTGLLGGDMLNKLVNSKLYNVVSNGIYKYLIKNPNSPLQQLKNKVIGDIKSYLRDNLGIDLDKEGGDSPLSNALKEINLSKDDILQIAKGNRSILEDRLKSGLDTQLQKRTGMNLEQYKQYANDLKTQAEQVKTSVENEAQGLRTQAETALEQGRQQVQQVKTSVENEAEGLRTQATEAVQGARQQATEAVQGARGDIQDEFLRMRGAYSESVLNPVKFNLPRAEDLITEQYTTDIRPAQSFTGLPETTSLYRTPTIRETLGLEAPTGAVPTAFKQAELLQQPKITFRFGTGQRPLTTGRKVVKYQSMDEALQQQKSKIQDLFTARTTEPIQQISQASKTGESLATATEQQLTGTADQIVKSGEGLAETGTRAVQGAVEEAGTIGSKLLSGAKSMGSGLLEGGLAVGASIGVGYDPEKYSRTALENSVNIGFGAKPLYSIGQKVSNLFSSKPQPPQEPQEIEMQDMASARESQQQLEQQTAEQETQEVDKPITDATDTLSKVEAGAEEGGEQALEDAGKTFGETFLSTEETLAPVEEATAEIPGVGDVISGALILGSIGYGLYSSIKDLFEGSDDTPAPPPPPVVSVPTEQFGL